MAPTTMEALQEKVDFVDLAHLYGLSFQKLDSLQNTRKDNIGLRKLVLIQTFMNNKLIAPAHESFEWTEDVKKDEENWLEACLDGLDEDEDGYVYIRSIDDYSKANYEDMMDLEQEGVITASQQIDKNDNLDDQIDMIIDDEVKHHEFLDNVKQKQKTHWRQKLLINERHQADYFEVNNHMITTSVEHNYHHWKDKSVIRTLPQEPPPSSLVTIPSVAPYRSFIDLEGSTDLVKRSSINNPHPTFCVPGFLRKYCLDRDYLVGINPDEIGDEPSISTAPNFSSVLSLSSDTLIDLSKSGHHTLSPSIVNSVMTLKRSQADMDLISPLAVTNVARLLEYVGDQDKVESREKIWFMDDGDNTRRQTMSFL